jgi:GNAT superfamily N-acetyltransferase
VGSRVGRPTKEIEIREQRTGSGATCRRILDALPHWFGVPASVNDYVAVAEESLSVVASVDGEDVGIVTIVSHGPYAAEVYVMGVLPEFHRQGIGRQMLRHVEAGLATAGVEFLQVKTLSGSKPDAGYEKTRAFYLSCGFRPLQEFPTLWDPENPALQMVKAIRPPPRP